MSQQVQNLGQVKGAANTEVTLVAAIGAGLGAVASKVYACNQSASADTINLRVAVGNAAVNAKQYLVYGLSVPANDTVALPLFDLGATDVVYVLSTNGNVSFSAFGAVFTQ